MNAVIGYSSLLLDDNLTPEQNDYVEGIRNGGEALLSIISDILEFSRAEKDKVELEHQPLSLKHCIEESLDIVAVQSKQKGLNLAYTVSYGTPDTIIGDQGRLRQILVNLLSNAVKFTDEGEVSVFVSSKDFEGNKRQITFAVKDTGIGIPRDKMHRLFKPFTQLEYKISRKVMALAWASPSARSLLNSWAARSGWRASRTRARPFDLPSWQRSPQASTRI